MNAHQLRVNVGGTVLRTCLVTLLVLMPAVSVVAGERGSRKEAIHDVELHVLDERGASSPVPVLTTGGPPEPPINWSRVGPEQPDRDSWILRVRILPVDPRRLVTVRIVGDVDSSGVPVSEPASFTCGGESPSNGMSCTASSEGRYTATWPRSLGARVAISSDLAVGTSIQYTTWAIRLSTPDDIA